MTKKRSHFIRIIAGQWRGRRLPVLDQATLRPTKDIVRETVFNWLQPYLPGSRCLDAFAGSGALGFEAASREAGEVIMLEPQMDTFKNLQQQQNILQGSHVAVLQVKAETYLQQQPEPFDIVFLDPPFKVGVLSEVCRLLADHGWLHSGSHVYLEAAKSEGYPELPSQWSWQRQKASGDVVYGLAVVT